MLHTGIGDNGAVSIAQALLTNKTILSLCLSTGNIGNEGAISIAQFISTNNTLLCLSLYCNEIGVDGASSIAQSLSTNSTLLYLSLYWNKIGDEGSWSIAQALSINKTLVSLDLSRNQISDTGAAHIVQSLSTNNTLVSLHLNDNQISFEGAVSIAQLLLTNRTLINLSLSGNNIGDKGTVSIVQSLSINNTLVSLDLGFNNIDTEGAESIAQVLSTNKTLVKLRLYGNQKIGSQGAVAILQALSMNKTLVSLNLARTEIGVKGIVSIAQALSTNSTLLHLNLAENEIGAEGVESVAESLTTNKTLVSLDLNCNGIGDEGAASIAKLLLTNNTLVSLTLVLNDTGDKGAVSIAQALSKNKSLLSLNLSSNKIGNNEAASIAQSLSTNNTLVSLDLSQQKIWFQEQKGKKLLSTLERKQKSWTHFLWFTWLKNPSSPGFRLLILLENTFPSLLYAIVGGIRYKAIPLGEGMFLSQMESPPLLNPSGDLFEIPIEIAESEDCSPCSCPSRTSIAFGKEYFQLNFTKPSAHASSMNFFPVITQEFASILRREFPQHFQAEPPLTQSCIFFTLTSPAQLNHKKKKKTAGVTMEGSNDIISQVRSEMLPLITTLKLELQQEKEIQMYLDQFTSYIDFSFMRAIEMSDVDLLSAKILGVGCNGTTSNVKLKPTNDWHIPRRMIEQGVALKMMYNLVIQPDIGVGTTEHQRNRFDREYLSLIQNQHWGVANIISFFRSYTQEALMPTRMCLVSSDTGMPLDTSPHNHQECVSIYNRTTFIMQELGSTTLQKHIRAAMPTKEPTAVLLPLGKDKTLESTFQLLSTVDHLNNKRGLFHLDIKSDNILLLERAGFTGQFTVLCDFGTSVSINPSGNRSTGVTPGMLELGQNEAPEGNLLNRAPEALRPVALKPRSSTYNVSQTDLWAVACVVWQMSFGTGPFASEEDITSRPVVVPAALARECRCLHQLLKRLLGRNPATRPSAGLASAFVGAHLFLPDLADLALPRPAPTPTSSPAASSAASSPSPSRSTSTSASASASASGTPASSSSSAASMWMESRIEKSLRALKARTCEGIRTMMGQQNDVDESERSISVRLFLQLVFIKQSTPALILQALTAFSL
ncbi:Protein NLRC3 [Pelomyxa schiedti]|nr:Protein NLRC3 [Pelomyxa schiedti]